MSIGKFYDNIDVIMKSMYDYHGIDKDDDDQYCDFQDDDSFDGLETVCTRDDIESSGLILETFIEELFAISNDDVSDPVILKVVEKTVKKLNKLNENCNYELIESSISDDICDYLQSAVIEAGLRDVPECVADEWRDF